MKLRPKFPFGVVVLYNESQDLIKGEKRDFIAENEVITCADSIAEALSSRYRIAKVPIHTNVEIALAPYPSTDWAVFNLGEGVEGRLFECARIAWAMEGMGYCFTGPSGDALARTTNKLTTNIILAKEGIPTPISCIYRGVSDIGENINFPLIVKPLAEDGSLGIDGTAVVKNYKELKERVEYIQKVYRQAAIVQSFIVGREFSIALWNNPPEILPISEIDFSAFSNPYDRIVSFAAKWEEESYDFIHTPPICPAEVNDRISSLLYDIAIRCWNALNCKDYARIDIRLDVEDTPFVIEVNCNPDLSKDAGFFRSAQVAGYSYETMIQNIFNFALQDFETKYFSFDQMM